MLGFPTVRELGNPGWRKNGHFQRANTLAWFSLFLWFVLLIVLLFVLFVFEFLLFYGNPKIFLENFPIFFQKLRSTLSRVIFGFWAHNWIFVHSKEMKRSIFLYNHSCVKLFLVFLNFKKMKFDRNNVFQLKEKRWREQFRTFCLVLKLSKFVDFLFNDVYNTWSVENKWKCV